MAVALLCCLARSSILWVAARAIAAPPTVLTAAVPGNSRQCTHNALPQDDAQFVGGPNFSSSPRQLAEISRMG
jgi:hypothetical protein